MPRYDFRTPRLHVEAGLAAGSIAPLLPEQAHYLVDVLRLKAGDRVLAFNGRDGEWLCELSQLSKKLWVLTPEEFSRSQTPPGDLHYLFAPLKRARLDYMVQKAVEMGASRLQPVLTQHTQAERVNTERMRANAIEAAEQCGILAIPEIGEPLALERAVAALEPARVLIFCDEGAETADPVRALTEHVRGSAGNPPEAGRERLRVVPLAVVNGPEGGFSEAERALLTRRPNTVRIALGPRILRADTAAVAALTVVQAALGDWR
jgi:16S rRNA (uracil1498-N3)-methyltransferase